MSLKRKGEEPSGALVVSKKQRTDAGAIIAVENRTSRLQAPTMLLEGHQVFTA
jgi:hypothetical protein